ncbi:MAG: Fe(3+) ABC transporter substrate-binding protein [Geminicoccaceae bacterium]|nr:Fe(3+) ABC transporter substrate-binding protein [Geminicoccaceae bacterium]
MTMRRLRNSLIVSLLVPAALASAGISDAAEVNLYSSRHYDTDEQLYSRFTEETGITVNRIEGDADELIERIRLEGEQSPADVFITVDAGRLWRAEEAGLFAPVESKILNERIPARLRNPEGLWFGFTTRARVIVYDRERVDPALIGTYEDLARPELEGLVCIRSSTNIYNLSLLASLIEYHGMDGASEWATGVVNNFARQPEGNDTNQIEAVAAGQCGVAVANSYYAARILNSDDPARQEIASKIGIIFPNQDDRGAHVNISGAGLVHSAPNRDEAIAFLEYLASDAAQAWLANGNNEYPAVESVKVDNPALDAMGEFKADPVNVSVLGKNQPMAQIIFDEAGWR